MKKIFTLVFALMSLAGVANAASVDDIAVCKHSYVFVADNYTNDGTGARTKGALFGDNHFLDVTGGSVATNKGNVDLSVADGVLVTEEIVAKYGKYGQHLNSLRLKNDQDVIALKVTAGSKLIIFYQNNGADRYPMFGLDSKPTTNPMANQGTKSETVNKCARMEWTAEDDQTVYIGGKGGDQFVSFIIVEANEAEGTPMVEVGPQTFADGLWFREVTCTPQSAYGMPTDVYYTTDGSDPTAENGVQYTEPIKCYNNTTVKFQAYSFGMPIDGADNEGNVNFSFNAPTIIADGGNVTVSSEYEGARNYVTLDGNLESAEEMNTFVLDASATVTAFSTIQNGAYALFTTKSVSQDVYVLNPIKEKKTIAVSGNVVVDEEATAEAQTADPTAATVYKVENAAISADKKDFFVKSVEYGILNGDNVKYQIDGQEVYLKMTDKTNITFQVAEGDSVDVVVVCSKNSCKTLNEENDETVTTDRKCYVNLSGKTYGSDDITGTHEYNGADEANNIIRFGLTAGTYTFQKYSGTGNILVASIEITPAEKTVTAIETVKAAADQNAPAYNLAGQKVAAGFKGLVVKGGKKMIVK